MLHTTNRYPLNRDNRRSREIWSAYSAPPAGDHSRHHGVQPLASTSKSLAGASVLPAPDAQEHLCPKQRSRPMHPICRLHSRHAGHLVAAAAPGPPQGMDVCTAPTERQTRPRMAAVRALKTPPEVVAVGTMSFVLSVEWRGSVRVVGEADFVGARGALPLQEAPLRGAFMITGLPTHVFGDLLFLDLAVGAGALWRACNHVAEPGTSVEFAVPDSASVVHLEHADRVLLIASFGADGELRSSGAYDPFAFIAGVEATCTRLERTLRQGGYSEATRRLYGYYARPDVP